MSKIVKLKQADIEKIVNNLVEQYHHGHHYDDFDTQIQPEELPHEDDIRLFDEPDYERAERDGNGNLVDPDFRDEENFGIEEIGEQGQQGGNVMIGKDREGKIYVIRNPNSNDPQIMTK